METPVSNAPLTVRGSITHARNVLLGRIVRLHATAWRPTLDAFTDLGDELGLELGDPVEESAPWEAVLDACELAAVLTERAHLAPETRARVEVLLQRIRAALRHHQSFGARATGREATR